MLWALETKGNRTMSRDLKLSEKEMLESLMDACSIESVLITLSDICEEKAEHVETTWQDKALARAWRTLGGAIGVHTIGRAGGL